ncbi:hypothetical protein BGW38_002665 [Lunasporangiospora selenospora]|uniref:Uncharacterized protein n=1 Tax=Lunasporangiospora selenospora TaxID=979761 RepID=A0A9P6FSG1_9FUNG|nr:hypothetical protein BGW38_002665 [Lunasporangiospora selenospora]
MAQVNSVFCQARLAANTVTCIIGVRECNVIEQFSACVCYNTGQKDKLRLCVIALLSSVEFQGVLRRSDYSIHGDLEKAINEAIESREAADQKEIVPGEVKAPTEVPNEAPKEAVKEAPKEAPKEEVKEDAKEGIKVDAKIDL